jgi:hypothetical protein
LIDGLAGDATLRGPKLVSVLVDVSMRIEASGEQRRAWRNNESDQEKKPTKPPLSGFHRAAPLRSCLRSLVASRFQRSTPDRQGLSEPLPRRRPDGSTIVSTNRMNVFMNFISCITLQGKRLRGTRDSCGVPSTIRLVPKWNGVDLGSPGRTPDEARPELPRLLIRVTNTSWL